MALLPEPFVEYNFLFCLSFLLSCVSSLYLKSRVVWFRTPPPLSSDEKIMINSNSSFWKITCRNLFFNCQNCLVWEVLTAIKNVSLFYVYILYFKKATCAADYGHIIFKIMPFTRFLSAGAHGSNIFFMHISISN